MKKHIKIGRTFHLIEQNLNVVCIATPSKFLFWESGYYGFAEILNRNNAWWFPKNAFDCRECCLRKIKII